MSVNNSVKADNQLNENQYISYINPDGKGPRIMFVGNSITRHGVKADIGWFNDWGMAASSMENDYVHIVSKCVLSHYDDASFCICQGSQWEVNWREGHKTFSLFKMARDFNADVIIMRLVENCNSSDYDGMLFKKEYGNFVSYLNGNGKAKIIISTGFWKHIADNDIRDYAEKNGHMLIELNDIGADESMRALGLFEHEGVANHPGDKGMKAIADRITEVLLEIL